MFRHSVRRHSSALSFSSGSSNPVLHGRYRSRRRRLKRNRERQRAILTILIAAIFCFGLVDLYYLFDVTKHHKLSEIKPALEMQSEKVKRVWDEEKEELSHFLPRKQNEEEYVENVFDEEVDEDKDEIFEILEQAGVHRSKLDKETRQKLPTWTMVQETYGTEPQIYGLERCSDFKANVEPSVSFLGIAGPFNSGTNLLAELLIKNCQIKERMEVFGEVQKGIRWQVPWGKHTPVQYREQHVTETDKDVPLENSFPMITIRDPYRWMRSMCKLKYGARWNHNKTTCPHVWSEESSQSCPVTVKYAETVTHHTSLPDFWNDWYNEYSKADIPRVIVRFEDLLFYGKNVTETLCKCGGGEPRRPSFVHVMASAKLGTAAHGSNKTNLLDALIQFGTNKGRVHGMTASDITHTRDLLDPFLMEEFQYHYADLRELQQEMIAS